MLDCAIVSSFSGSGFSCGTSGWLVLGREVSNKDNILGILSLAKRKDMERKAVSMVSFRRERRMDLEGMPHTKDNGNTVDITAMECTSGQMVLHIMENGRMIVQMEKEQ